MFDIKRNFVYDGLCLILRGTLCTMDYGYGLNMTILHEQEQVHPFSSL